MSPSWEVREGNCIDLMRAMPAGSVDAVVCDPPYLIGFMGKAFDSQHKTFVERKSNRRAGSFEAEHGNHNPVDSADQARTRLAEGRRAQAWHEAWAREALRVLKPGGYLIAAGGSRTYHRLTAGVEDAGFEVRDCITWHMGSGFPKSLDAPKAIEAHGRPLARAWFDGPHGSPTADAALEDLTDRIAPMVDVQEDVDGFGTALKPATEFMVVARKSPIGTVAANLLAHGTSALNIDGCRIGTGEGGTRAGEPSAERVYGGIGGDQKFTLKPGPRGGSATGRWPANVVLDEAAAAELDRQSGTLHWQDPATRLSRSPVQGVTGFSTGRAVAYADKGGASRFFYVAKASRAERNAGLDAFAERAKPTWSSGEANPGTFQAEGTSKTARNVHPTVKPLKLMQWLVRLVCPPGGLVLDPFAGSGSTGCAAVMEGFDFLGLERESEYVEIARARIAHWAERRPVDQLSMEVA